MANEIVGFGDLNFVVILSELAVAIYTHYLWTLFQTKANRYIVEKLLGQKTVDEIDSLFQCLRMFLDEEFCNTCCTSVVAIPNF
jgi:hypothetical protein